jgi:hypothetical protein
MVPSKRRSLARYVVANHAKGRWEGKKEENLTTDFTDFDGWESIRSRKAEIMAGQNHKAERE